MYISLNYCTKFFFSWHVHFAAVSILPQHENKVPIIPPKYMRYL